MCCDEIQFCYCHFLLRQAYWLNKSYGEIYIICSMDNIIIMDSNYYVGTAALQMYACRFVKSVFAIENSTSTVYSAVQYLVNTILHCKQLRKWDV